jgi:hypothetical protein
MALKLPFKLPTLGKQTNNQPSSGARTIIPANLSGPATIDPNATIVGRAITRSSGFRIPVIGHLPLIRQIRYLLILLGI